MKRLLSLLLSCIIICGTLTSGVSARQLELQPEGVDFQSEGVEFQPDTLSAQVENTQTEQPETEDTDTESEPTDGETDTESEPADGETDETAADTTDNSAAKKLDISQGTVPFIDESDPLMSNLAVYMVELTTDTLIHSRNADVRKYPASLTKIMTAILTLENIPDLNRKLTFTAELQDYVYQINVMYGGGISTGGIVLNEELTVEQLLYAIMLPSANEAAVMLAYEIGNGSLQRFYDMMNEKARELGCIDTHFANSNGLFDADHYTTAYDLYLITKYALQNDTFRKIASTPSYDTGPTNKQDNLHWDNTNKMIVEGSGFYYPQITGTKTGTLEEAGRCLITTATKDGYEYLLVLMGAPYMDENGGYITPNQAFVLTAKFYDWVFDTYKAKTIVEKGDKVSSINNVRLSKDGKSHLQLVSGQTFSALIPSNIDVSNVRRIAYNLDGERIGENDYIDAPVEKGKKLGTLKLILYGSELGTVDLIAAEAVEASSLLIALDQIHKLFQQFWFKFIFLFVLIFVAIYIVLIIIRSKRRKKYRRVSRRRYY